MAVNGRTFLITGANRGLGLGLAQILHKHGAKIIGTTRDESNAGDLKKVAERVIVCDVDHEDSLKAAADRLKADGVHLNGIINNSGILDHATVFKNLSDVKPESVEKHFRVNTLGPIRVIQAFSALLASSPFPIIVNISSILGSIGSSRMVYSYDYNISKAAVNMFSKLLSIERKDSCVISLHPGWVMDFACKVKTDLGGSEADLTIDQSTNGMYNVINGLGLKDSGKFLNWEGKEVLW